MTAPAAFSRSTASVSAWGRRSLNFGSPMLVGRPATSKLSLTVIGRPRSGWLSPFASATSAAAAASRARSKSRTTTALIWVDRLDPGDRGVDQLPRGNLPVGEHLHQFAGCTVVVACCGACRNAGADSDRANGGHERATAW